MKAGHIIKSLISGLDLTKDKLYVVTTVLNSGRVRILDDAGDYHGLDPQFYEHIGDLSTAMAVQPPLLPSLPDIHGQAVTAGDYIAYAFAGPRYNHLAVFEVLSVNGPTALCRSVIDSAVITLGVFSDRALKLKDYNK